MISWSISYLTLRSTSSQFSPVYANPVFSAAYEKSQQHSLNHWWSMYCFPAGLELSRAQAAWSLGVGVRWKNTTLSHCCIKRWNVAGIWLQWWSVALVTGRGFRWRLMWSWWQKAKRQPVYGKHWGDIIGVSVCSDWQWEAAWLGKCGKRKVCSH